MAAGRGALDLAGRLRAGALHAGARARAASGLRSRLQEAGGRAGGVILLQGGACACRNDTDHEELFRQESYFHYLFGVVEGGCFGAVDVASGRSTLFVPKLPEEYAVWMGEVPSLGERDCLPPPSPPSPPLSFPCRPPKPPFLGRGEERKADPPTRG